MTWPPARRCSMWWSLPWCAPPALIELGRHRQRHAAAKHAFASGIAAQPGIEW